MVSSNFKMGVLVNCIWNGSTYNDTVISRYIYIFGEYKYSLNDGYKKVLDYTTTRKQDRKNTIMSGFGSIEDRKQSGCLKVSL